MNDLLQGIGFLAICFVIVYGYQKILEYYDVNRSAFPEDERVYQAAEAFARGAPPDEVRAILDSCLALDAGDSEEILARALPHRADRDGGYKAFIRSANRVLGGDIYSERRRKDSTASDMRRRFRQ